MVVTGIFSVCIYLYQPVVLAILVSIFHISLIVTSVTLFGGWDSGRGIPQRGMRCQSSHCKVASRPLGHL